MAPFTLRERGAVPFPWTDADLRALARIEPRGALGAVARAGWGLRAGGHVGFTRLPSGAVRVVPKAGAADGDVAAANVLATLARVGALPRSPRPDELRAVRGDWVEALIALFAGALADALGRGPILGPATVHVDASAALRGRLRVAALAARPARAHLFPIEFVERRPDAPPLRALRWTVERLAPLARLPASRSVLARLELDLAAVPAVAAPPAGWFEKEGLTRHEARFLPALALAKLLRGGLTAALAPGEASAVAFWVDADRLFERLGAYLARRAAPAGWSVSAQDGGLFLGWVEDRPALRLRPDLVLRDADGPCLVVDTKHKVWKGAPSEDDAYAMAAYVRRYGVERGVLLYPRPPGPAPEWRMRLHGGGWVEARFLDLARDLHAPGAWGMMEAEMREALGVG